MCRFNTEGPVRPDMHYCIPPLAWLDDVDRVLGLVRDPPAKTAASAPLFAHPVRPLRDRTLYDGRRDRDADWGVKGAGKRWCGYLVRLIVDATYELPVAFKVTNKSATAQLPRAEGALDCLGARVRTYGVGTVGTLNGCR